MSVHQLPDGRWVIQYKSDGRLKREYFGRGPEAEKQARERNAVLPLRSWKRRTPEPGGVYFGDLAQAYLDAMAANLQEDSRRYLTHNPIAKYRKPKRDDEVIQPRTQDEITALMSVAPSWLVRALCLSYYTGIRPGRAELLRRKWADVDWQAKTIWVESARKGGLRTRQVSLHKDLHRLLKRWLKEDKSLKAVPETIIHYKG